MSEKPGDMASQPEPDGDGLPSGGEPTASNPNLQGTACPIWGEACPIWGEACRPVTDPATGEIIGRACLLLETVKHQPPKHGEVHPESIHRLVSAAEELAEGDGYDGPCLELPTLKQLAAAKRAQYPIEPQSDPS